MQEEIKKLMYKDADTLLSEPMPQIRFHIPGILPHGTHLLCGSPKVGKSWMALWLAVRIASGEPVWGIPTEPCGVLYLGLEDTEQRIRDRLYHLTECAPERLHIAVRCERLFDGLQEELEHYLMMNPDTGIVIIDTLQKVRADRYDNSLYRADYNDITAIKQLGDDLGITFILVHHLRKMADDTDPFNMISGSNGLSGAVDGMYLLQKDKRTENTAMLIATGRDIEMQQFRLAFEDRKWEMLEMAQTEQLQEKVPDILYDIVDFVREKRVWFGSSTLLCRQLLEEKGAQANPFTITKYLSRFADSFLKENKVGYSTSRSAKSRQIGLYLFQSEFPNMEDPAFEPAEQDEAPSAVTV